MLPMRPVGLCNGENLETEDPTLPLTSHASLGDAFRLWNLHLLAGKCGNHPPCLHQQAGLPVMVLSP